MEKYQQAARVYADSVEQLRIAVNLPDFEKIRETSKLLRTGCREAREALELHREEKHGWPPRVMRI